MLTLTADRDRNAVILLQGSMPLRSLCVGGREVYDLQNLENDAVAAYVHGTYYPEGYGSEHGDLEGYPSFLRPYYGTYVNEGWYPSEPSEWPRPFALSTPRDCCEVLISETEGFDDVVRFKGKPHVSLLFNLIPQRKYYYKAVDSGGVVLDSGSFQTRGQVRMIALRDVWNCRDIGGWKCEGGHIAYGKILRGTHLDYVNDEHADLDILLNRLKVTAELDTRLKSKEYNGSPIGVTYYGTKYNASKVVTADKYGISSYVTLVKTPTNFLNCIKAVLEACEAGGCIYIHCKHGTDRTGTFIALLMGLLGCTENGMIKEWGLTSFWSWLNTKKIDTEDLDDFPQGELRTMLKYLWDNFGGDQGASAAEQIQLWFRTKVCAGLSDLGAGYISRLRACLVEAD